MIFLSASPHVPKFCHSSSRELSVEQFKKEYEGGSLPMIIKNGINHWPAMKWTKETFLEKFKDRKVR
jgi:hypothetical protein